MTGRAPSLVNLCVQTAIDNVRYLVNVGDTDDHLLERILPHCTLQQLMHVENCSEGRDLSPITNGLWKNFFERQFGAKNADIVAERMEKKKIKFTWRQLYEARLKTPERLREAYKAEETAKKHRQIRLCNKLPPSGHKRNFSNTKSSIMKKAKLEFLNSREVKNLAVMKNVRAKNVDLVAEKMEKAKVEFSRRLLYEEKVKDQEDKEQRLAERMRERYKIEEAKKRNRQIQLCDKYPTVPSTSHKRKFYGEPDSPVSRTKGKLMKKAKFEFVNSIEFKNFAAMKFKMV